MSVISNTRATDTAIASAVERDVGMMRPTAQTVAASRPFGVWQASGLLSAAEGVLSNARKELIAYVAKCRAQPRNCRDGKLGRE